MIIPTDIFSIPKHLKIITSLQEEFFVNLNESDTEDEEENELLSQEYSLSLENSSSLISDNSGICNSSIIGNGIDAGNHKKVMKVREDTGMNFDMRIFRRINIEFV